MSLLNSVWNQHNQLSTIMDRHHHILIEVTCNSLDDETWIHFIERLVDIRVINEGNERLHLEDEEQSFIHKATKLFALFTGGTKSLDQLRYLLVALQVDGDVRMQEIKRGVESTFM